MKNDVNKQDEDKTNIKVPIAKDWVRYLLVKFKFLQFV